MAQNDELYLDAELVRRQLNRVVSSNVFSAAKRSRMFLRYIVERTLLGSPPKEFEIAAEVLGRGADYDPDIDATVRVEASRLRYRLREYYDTAGKNDPIFINIPKGAYRAIFVSAGAIPAVSASVTEDFSVPLLLSATDAPCAGSQALDSVLSSCWPLHGLQGGGSKRLVRSIRLRCCRSKIYPETCGKSTSLTV